jgi:hypothetical protein
VPALKSTRLALCRARGRHDDANVPRRTEHNSGRAKSLNKKRECKAKRIKALTGRRQRSCNREVLCDQAFVWFPTLLMGLCCGCGGGRAPVIGVTGITEREQRRSRERINGGRKVEISDQKRQTKEGNKQP